MPAFTAIGAYVATTVFGLAGTAALVVGALVATGAAYITSRIINGNPNKGNNSAQGSQGGRIQVPPATNNKIPVVYGSAYVNGIISDARLISTDQKTNNTMFYCIVLSETCNTAGATYTLNDIYWNDLRLTQVDATTNAHKIKDGRKTVDGPGEDFIDTNFVVDGNSLVEMRVYAGSSAANKQIFPTQASGNTQAAYDFWGNNDNSWTSSFDMKGLVFAIVKVTYNGEKGFTGLPNVTFQLANSVSNPADVWYDYMTGARYGANIDASYIDSAAKTAWANFCDEDITYIDKDGTTEQLKTRYSINGVIDTSRPVKENIDIIMQNGGAWLSYDVSSGYWSPIIKKAVSAGELGLSGTYFTASRSGSTLTVTNFPTGRIEAGQLLYNSSGTLIGTITAQLTPTTGETAGQKGRYTTSTSGSISSTTFYTLPATMLAFSDDNIISGINISSTRLDDLYNSYEAEFYDKFNKDQKAYARNEIPSGERNPNEPDNQLRLSLDLCNNSVQADLLAKLELTQSRDDLVVEFTSNFYGIQAQAGDVISIYSELYDWAPKYFRVMRVKEQETEEGGLVAQIQALEYNPDVYTVEPITEFTTSANIGIGVYGASPNLPQPPVVFITEIDTDVAIPNFQLQIEIPTTGGPYDEIELYYTEGWDPMSITGTIVPGTGSNGAPVGDGLLTVTAVDFGAVNVGDDFTVGSTEFTITAQLTNNPVSKTFVSGGVIRTNTVTLNDAVGLKIGNTLMGTGLGTFGASITSILGSQVTLSRPFDTQAAGTYTISGGLGTYIVDTSATLSGTTTLFDLPVDSDYVYLKKVSPEGNNPTFTNGETITTIITEVPANTATYRRWFIKARMGIKKRFGRFSTPTTTDRNGNFRYTPNPVASGRLSDLSDVDINNATLGDFLWYNGTSWINENEPSVDTLARTLRLTRTGNSAGEDYESEIALRLNDRLTDTNSYINDEGGPGIFFERSSGLVYTKNWVSGGAVGAFTVTLNNSTDLAIGHLITGTGLPTTGALITNIAGPLITLNTAFTQQAAGSYSTGTPIAFGLIAMEWHGTDNVHKFKVITSTDNFNPGTGSPPPYPNSPVLIESTKNYTEIHNGVLYVDAVNNRVGVNGTTPSYELHVFDTGNDIAQIGLSNSERSLVISNDATNDLLTFNYNSANRLQFDLTNQWFNSGNLGVNKTNPAYALDVTGEINLTGENLYMNQDNTDVDVSVHFNTGRRLKWSHGNQRFEFNGSVYVNDNLTVAGSTFLGNNYIVDQTDVVGQFKVTNNSIDNLFVDRNTGYVGINDNTPTVELDVTGSGSFTGNLAVNGGDITTTDTNTNIFNTGATTLNIGGAGTAINIGANSGTMTIGNPTVVGTQTTQNLFNTTATTLNIGGASTSTNIGAASGTTTIGNNLSIKGTNLVLNSDGTGTEDVTITFERGGDDARIKWNETTERFEFSKPITTEINNGIRVSQDLFGTDYHGAIISGLTGSISTGGDFYFQRNGGTYPSNNASIYVDRAASATDSFITWNESDVSWNISNSVTIADNLNVASGVLFVDDTSNEVGINTTTPTKALDVVGEAKISSEVTIGNTSTFSNVNYQEVRFETYNFNAATGVPTQVGIDLFAKATYRSARYSITMTQGSRYQMVNISIIHDGTTAYMSISDDIATGANIATFDLTVDSTHVVLYATVNGTVNFKWYRWLTETN